MASTFDGTLPTDEILQGATAVALGRLIEVVDSDEDPDSAQRRLFTYRVEVDDVLTGTLESEIRLRVVGRNDDPEHQQLLVLTPDLGVDRDNQYVPYFNQPTPVGGGLIAIGDGAMRGVDEIRERLSSLGARQERARRALAEEERDQDVDEPYPPITEVGEGRGDTVVDAQLAEPRDGADPKDG